MIDRFSLFGQFMIDSKGFRFLTSKGESLAKWEVFWSFSKDADFVIRGKVKGVKALQVY